MAEDKGSLDKNELLRKIQLAQKQNYDRKKATMYGTGAQKKSVLGNVGAMTLEQMDLDRREDFSNFDPFMY